MATAHARAARILLALVLQLRDPTRPWARDARVREALMRLLDRDEIAEQLFFGTTRPADFFAAPNGRAYALAAADGRRYSYNPQRAAQLMAEAGWDKDAAGLVRNHEGDAFHIDTLARAAIGEAGLQGNIEEASAVAVKSSKAGLQSETTTYPVNRSNPSELRHSASGALLWPGISNWRTSGRSARRR
jgi:ABC-type transport system substrate-binding protein